MDPGYTTFWEMLARRYPLYPHVRQGKRHPGHKYNFQGYFVAIACAAGQASAAGPLKVQVPFFAFDLRSQGFITATGAVMGGYRIGIAMQSGSDWTNGQWQQAAITGDSQGVAGSFASEPYDFAWPREVPATTELTITILPPLGSATFAANSTVHAGLTGIEVRERAQQLPMATR